MYPARDAPDSGTVNDKQPYRQLWPYGIFISERDLESIIDGLSELLPGIRCTVRLVEPTRDQGETYPFGAGLMGGQDLIAVMSDTEWSWARRRWLNLVNKVRVGENKGKNLDGRAYLVSKVGEHGASRRRAVAIVNLVFREMGLTLRRGEYVEFPFGYLYAYKRLSQRWEMIGDEPMRPWWVEHGLDEEGERLLGDKKLRPWPPGWSLKPDKNSVVYILDRGRKRSRKAERRSPAKASGSRGSGK